MIPVCDRRAVVVSRLVRAVTLAIALTDPFPASHAGAQSPASRSDSLVERMQRLASAGDRIGLRRVTDSLLAATSPGDPRHGEALYWRATARETADSSRQDLLKLIVDFPMSERVEDALVRLANDEIHSGDRVGARRHLERLVHDHLTTDRGAKAAQQLAQMLFDEGAAVAGCVVLDSASAHVSQGNVELANQIAYAGRRCTQIGEAVAAPPDTVHTATPDSGAPKKPSRSGAKPAAKPATAARPAPATDRQWTVQVAAYAVHGDALRLEARLKARGYEARIAGEKPYRVRIGRFTNRRAAADVVARLKGERTTAIIVEAERP